ncbi:uncharacterized protein LOC111054514 [Nilaparvata lugens]|uniref:uncharacterized protein LOC111054514 n=1 Tax=Nilaparvata lugens TaxID=108931 RepID=UPI00193CD983|nr:uncharacterized protein LOC111054514 [Nilaparvata lugens]
MDEIVHSTVYRFSSVFSSIYGYQLAFNFLFFLFLGFGWTGAIYRFVAPKDIDTGDVLQLLGLCVEIGECFVWIFVGSTTADTAQRAMDIEMKNKLLEIIRSNKENLSNEEENIFLKIVSRTKTEMKLGGYGRIDRNFLYKVLLAWANYTLILLQFRNLILDTSKDDPDKKAGLILEWSADT